MALSREDDGRVEVVCGSMFSGKTEELIRRLRRALLGRLRVQAFKPALDDRYHETKIVSHGALSLDAEVVHDARSLLESVRPDTEVVGIDEAQFFGMELVEVAQTLADRGVRVILAGLDQDYRGRPFEPVPSLMAIAEDVTKCHAVCTSCGGSASRSQRVIDTQGGAQVQVGAADSYEARCRHCFEHPELAHPRLARAAG
ncbi:MAG: thymidine kinase [Deltaproteobacteria bacterium]|nr:thymidine kinase [Deltaproteobacteria bacterium]